MRGDCRRIDSDRWWLVTGLRRADAGDTDVLIKRGLALVCCEDERFTNLLGARRELDGRGRIGLADPLKDGVTGLSVDGLSVWKDTIESRRSQLVEGRREWDS